jgi:hypothetical protein
VLPGLAIDSAALRGSSNSMARTAQIRTSAYLGPALVSAHKAQPVKQTIEEARRVGRAHGVGLITMGDPRAWDTWNELKEARRVEPDPERLDEFISVQLSQDAHDRIAPALH